MIYWQLFLSFLQIGMFSFGGRLCSASADSGAGSDAAWVLSRSEFTDLITISQMTPGPIAVNSATFCRHPAGQAFWERWRRHLAVFCVVHPGNGAVLSLFKIP